MRAWVNMGISYANQNKHLTAAKYYAKALKYAIDPIFAETHSSRQNDHAEHIWSYMRIACTALGREDLVQKVDVRDPKLYEAFL